MTVVIVEVLRLFRLLRRVCRLKLLSQQTPPTFLQGHRRFSKGIDVSPRASTFPQGHRRTLRFLRRAGARPASALYSFPSSGAVLTCQLLPLWYDYGSEIQVQRRPRCGVVRGRLKPCLLPYFLTFCGSVLLHYVKRSSPCMRNAVVSFYLNAC